MKLTLADTRYLKDSITTISELINEGTLKISKDQMELVAMDPANVAMVVFRMLSSSFVEFNVDKEYSLTLNIENMSSILSRIKPNEILTMILDEKENKLKFEFKGQKKRIFDLALLDYEEAVKKVPELKFPLKIEMDSVAFNDAIEDASLFADSVELMIEDGKFVIKGEGNMNASRTDLEQDEDTVIHCSEARTRAKYSIEYMKKITKGTKLSPKVIIQFDKEYPLRVDYRVINKLDMTFILAPMVDND